MFAVASLAALLIARRIWLGYQSTPGLHVLTRGEASFLRAAGDAMFPRGGAPAPSASDAGIDRYVDDYMDVVPPSMARLMRALFFLMEHATVLFPAPAPRGWRRFSSLSPEQRVAVLDAWNRSGWFPRRLAFTSLRAVLTNGYVSDASVLAELGLTPFEIESPVREADLLYPHIGAPRSAIRYTRADLTPAADPVPLRAESAEPPA